MRLFRSARLLLLALVVCAIPAASNAGIFISVNFGPPILPVYEVPPCPQPNLIWTPGYWAYGDEGYFWVPGAWVPAPFNGGLWTPGYWGWNNNLYVYNPGYWGYHVGYYGGVNYGGGYLGIGFAGGEWRGGNFAYNTAVVHVNETVIHTTYIDQTIIQRNTVVNPNHVAYSGGPGGVQHTATPQEQVAAHETHTAPTSFQTQHIQSAQTNKQSYAKANGGHPTQLAVAKPLAVESHPAPAHTSIPAGETRANVTPARTTAPPAAGHPAGPAHPSVTPEGRPGTPAVEPHTYTPPAHATTAPPKQAAPKVAPKPAPKPATKPKPDGHEK